MIDGESRYQIEIAIDCPPGENWLMRLVFYDKYEAEAGSIVLRDKVTVFQCPLKTYSYRLLLICNCTSSADTEIQSPYP